MHTCESLSHIWVMGVGEQHTFVIQATTTRRGWVPFSSEEEAHVATGAVVAGSSEQFGYSGFAAW